MMEWGLQKLGFCRNSNRACAHSHGCSLSPSLPLNLLLLPCFLGLSILSCPHIHPSIYSRSLPTLFRSLCYWKSEEWAQYCQCISLSQARGDSEAGRKKRRGRKRLWQTGKHESAPVPLSPHCLWVSDVSKRQESEEREDREQRLRALFGLLASDPVKVHWEENEGWDMGMEERALGWPRCRISFILTVNRSWPPTIPHVLITCELW